MDKGNFKKEEEEDLCNVNIPMKLLQKDRT